MKLPGTKDETDKILFELLEGNLTKSEEEFWYDYALKNADFAKQLALFQRIYLKDNVLSYPNHSNLLRKPTLFAKLKWPMIVSSSLVFVGIMAFYVLYKNRTDERFENTTKPIIKEQIHELKEMKLPAKTESLPLTKPIVKEKQNETVVDEQEIVESISIEDAKQPSEIEKPLVVADTIPERIVETKTEEQKSQPESKTEEAMVGKQEVEQTKAVKKSNVIKFKMKPSRKTKTTDFNY